MRKFLLPLLSAFLGFVFLFSAWSKFSGIEFFELAVVDSGFIGWSMAPVLARLIISVEFFIGILLILNLSLKRITIPLTLTVLVFFTLYLSYSLVFKGNRQNCHCFGALIPLNPLESIIKNAILIVCSIVLMRYHPGLEWRRSGLIIGLVILLSFLLVFLGNPVNSGIEGSGLPGYTGPLDLDRIYTNPKAVKPSRDLRKGKQLIAFLSLKCPYCIMAGNKLRLMLEDNPSLPVYFIVNGKLRDIPAFLEETKAYRVPQTLLLGEDFKILSGHKVPSVFYVESSVVVKEVSPVQLNQADVEKWLSK